MRGIRVLTLTCLGITMKRLMREMKVDLHTVAEGTGIPYTTLYDWTNGVIASNPDQLHSLSRFFKVSVDHLLYGNDEDKEKLKKQIAELEEKNRKLEFENADQRAQLSIFEEIKKAEKEKTASNG